jgi:TPR repeat protein
MIFLEYLNFFKNIKRFKKNRRRTTRRIAHPQQQSQACGDTIKNDIPLQPEAVFDAEFGSWFELESEPRLEQEPEEHAEVQDTGVNIESDDRIDPAVSNEEDQKETDAAEPAVELVTGGIYGIREREGEPYQLAKIVYIEDHLVHVIRYAACPRQLMPGLDEETLITGVDERDGSFGAEHLPIPKSSLLENSVYIQPGSLSEQDVQGYQLYVDSVFDCLDDSSPGWLKKAGSYAAWRHDHNAMAALADRYLVGVDLPRDSRKALYWLNRLVHEGRDLVRSRESVSEERQILTGGIYACATDDGRCEICKVVLKDKHGVQKLVFPSPLDQLPADLNPISLLEEVSQTETGKSNNFTHASVNAETFLKRDVLFIGILPVTAAEIHCYRTYLQEMFAGADFQASAWDKLLRQAESGDVWSQDDIAHRCLTGDPVWEVEKNIPEAVRWFTEAANQGHGLAAYNLAIIHQQGKGVQSNLKLGFEWLVYAAKLNCGLAQQHTADCYRRGGACATDPALAHAWYSMAAVADNELTEEQKNRAEMNKKEIETELSAEQLAEAREYFRQLREQS